VNLETPAAQNLASQAAEAIARAGWNQHVTQARKVKPTLPSGMVKDYDDLTAGQRHNLLEGALPLALAALRVLPEPCTHAPADDAGWDDALQALTGGAPA
jgi:hypothetical protein